MGNRIDSGKHDGGAQPRFPDGPSGGRVPDAAELLDAQLPDFDWAVLRAGFTRTEFPAPSGALAMIALGNPDAPAVVLVPGATGSKEDFVLMMPILAAAGYYTISFDMAGQYESAGAGPENLNPPRRSYDHALFVEDLLAVLRHVGRPAHVVGYSFAGTVAGLAHAREPGLFASLTLLSCPPLSGQSFRGVGRIGPFTGLANGRVGAALMVWGIKRNLVPVPPGRLRFVRDRFALTRRQSVRDIVTLMKDSPNLATSLRGAKLPKLVAVGEHDLWPTPLHAEFAASIGAQLHVYHSGHSPCETSPHQLCRDLLALFGNTAK
ncbi:MAG: alpha/beta hydrolase [Specibacter sp.]